MTLDVSVLLLNRNVFDSSSVIFSLRAFHDRKPPLRYPQFEILARIGAVYLLLTQILNHLWLPSFMSHISNVNIVRLVF
jgi:hypothetical protein